MSVPRQSQQCQNQDQNSLCLGRLESKPHREMGAQFHVKSCLSIPSIHCISVQDRRSHYYAGFSPRPCPTTIALWRDWGQPIWVWGGGWGPLPVSLAFGVLGWVDLTEGSWKFLQTSAGFLGLW